jgi:hypothetical protein
MAASLSRRVERGTAGYPVPTHEGVKDMLIFRTDRMHALARRVTGRYDRRRVYAKPSSSR